MAKTAKKSAPAKVVKKAKKATRQASEPDGALGAFRKGSKSDKVVVALLAGDKSEKDIQKACGSEDVKQRIYKVHLRGREDGTFKIVRTKSGKIGLRQTGKAAKAA